MSGTHIVHMGDRGRLVVPASMRERLGLAPGTPLVLVEEQDGLVVLTREQAKRRVRAVLDGPSLVDELLGERRAEAEIEDRG